MTDKIDVKQIIGISIGIYLASTNYEKMTTKEKNKVLQLIKKFIETQQKEAKQQ